MKNCFCLSRVTPLVTFRVSSKVDSTALGLQIWLICFGLKYSSKRMLLLNTLLAGHFSVVTLLLDKAQQVKLLMDLLQIPDHVKNCFNDSEGFIQLLKT